MGQRMPLPDDRMTQLIQQFQLSNKEVKRLFKVFTKGDKEKSGSIDLGEFYSLVDEKPSAFSDNIFKLIGCSSDSELTFSEFTGAVCTYCMFDEIDILKFCFYIFDQDKNGFIDSDEFNALVNMLHESQQNSNVLEAVKEMDSNQDGKIDFAEFVQMNRTYPQILFPAFRIQNNMMVATGGHQIWLDKRHKLEKVREEKREEKRKKKREKKKKKKEAVLGEVRRRMGPFQYYFCPFRRLGYIRELTGKRESEESGEGVILPEDDGQLIHDDDYLSSDEEAEEEEYQRLAKERQIRLQRKMYANIATDAKNLEREKRKRRKEAQRAALKLAEDYGRHATVRKVRRTERREKASTRINKVHPAGV